MPVRLLCPGGGFDACSPSLFTLFVDFFKFFNKLMILLASTTLVEQTQGHCDMNKDKHDSQHVGGVKIAIDQVGKKTGQSDQSYRQYPPFAENPAMFGAETMDDLPAALFDPAGHIIRRRV